MYCIASQNYFSKAKSQWYHLVDNTCEMVCCKPHPQLKNISNRLRNFLAGNEIMLRKIFCQEKFISNCNFIKKDTLRKVFSREFCKIFKNINFYRTSPVAAPVLPNFPLVLFIASTSRLFSGKIYFQINWIRRIYSPRFV